MSQGGRHLNEWLSEKGSAYIGIQAGLANTQLEHIPMKAHETWEWVEAYTGIYGSPDDFHGDYDAAVGKAGEHLKNRIGDARTLKFPSDESVISSEFIAYGSDFGSLEESVRGKRIRRTLVFQRVCSPETAMWRELLENNTFPCPLADSEPASYMTGEFWEKKPEELENQNWYSLLQLGVTRCALYAYGKYDSPDAFMKSDEMTPDPWALRNIAMLYKNEYKILHEKWNKSQNWFELSEFTKRQIMTITDECHKRGIKVLTYFGYEISSMSPEWSELHDRVAFKGSVNQMIGGWWRVPFQRDYVVCYKSDYADLFIDGITKIMDECHTDGVYLDGTHHARLCYSTEHGCGWYDHDGKLHGSYGWKAIRKLFKRLYDVVEPRGGEINVHAFGFVNFTAIPCIHQNWYGENLQFALNKGSTADMNLDYFRAEYLGRNIGAPVEFIAYANPPLWTFEMALASSLLHGILPRPNDLGHPLELMSRVRKIFGSFPIDRSEWLPYWKNDVKTSHEKVRVSYYRFTDLSGDPQLLAFVVNISAGRVEDVSVKFTESVSTLIDAERGERVGNFDLEGYGYRIIFAK